MVRESRRFSTLFSRKNATITSPSGTPILTLPNELFLIIASYLTPHDLIHFIVANRRLANLLTPVLYNRSLKNTPESRYAASVTRRAASMGHENVVRFMLDRGVSITDPVPWIGMEYPLHLAAKEGHAGVVQLMMEHEAGGEKAVSLVDDHGNTPFHLAALNGHRSVVGILLEKGVDPDLPSEIGVTLHGATALHYAAAWGHASVVKLLLRKGADANARTKDWPKNTPLQWVLENFCCLVMWRPLNFEPIIRILLANGADISLTDSHGRTVLHFATTNGDYSIQRRFGEHESQIKSGAAALTPLKDPKQRRDLAKSLHKAVVSLLLKSGANINARDTDGKTPLHYAAEHRKEYVVRNLLELGADPNAKTLKGETALQLVVNYAWSPDTNDTVQALLENGADLNVKDIFGRTALEVAEYGAGNDKGQKQLARLMKQFASAADPQPKPKPKSLVSRLLHIGGASRIASSSLTRRHTPSNGIATKAAASGNTGVTKSAVLPKSTPVTKPVVPKDTQVTKPTIPPKDTKETKGVAAIKTPIPAKAIVAPIDDTTTEGIPAPESVAATEDSVVAKDPIETENAVATSQVTVLKEPTKTGSTEVTENPTIKDPITTEDSIVTGNATTQGPLVTGSTAATDNAEVTKGSEAIEGPIATGTSVAANNTMVSSDTAATNEALAPKDPEVTRSTAAAEDTMIGGTAEATGSVVVTEDTAAFEDPVKDASSITYDSEGGKTDL